MKPPWIKQRSYEKPNVTSSIFQLVTTILPYFALLFLMYIILKEYSYWWNIPLILLASALLVRIFIIFHDCVHLSYFKSGWVNAFIGFILGILVFTDFNDWRKTHLFHHGSFGNLEKRGVGDVWTMTAREFTLASRTKQLKYQIYRNPIILIGPGSFFLFLIWNRFPVRGAGLKEIISVIFTNLALLSIIALAYATIGIHEYIMIQLPVITLAGMFGTWLFYIQHQYEGVQWWHAEEWSPYRAAMEGSSFYNLPAILRWFSGNIGYHHIHHLSSRIPNYNLKQCYDENPELQEIVSITLFRSFRSLFLQLWDEDSRKLIGIADLKRKLNSPASSSM